MDNTELLDLLNRVESSRAERKPNEKQSDSIRKAICSFANDLPDSRKPGVIFVGVNDDGSCANLPITDKLLRTLADMASDGNITPFPRIEVEAKTLQGCEMAVVVVHPADAPPVRFKSCVYVRVAGSNRIASDADIRILSEKRRSLDLPYDLHPLQAATLEDLDLGWFAREYLPSAVGEEELTANDRTHVEHLTSVRFAALPPEPSPTVLGMLVAGVDPRGFIPGAYVQFMRFDGCELTDPIMDQKEITGTVSMIIKELDHLLRVNIRTTSDFTSAPREINKPDYPAQALEQILRNAILHRSYEATNAPTRVCWFNDRVEIQSPGGPYGQVTAENFGAPGIVDYRNPHLAEALRNLGYVQRFGLGIQTAKKHLAENGNPDIEFTVETSYILATIRSVSCR